jgi:hypothetical protein
LTVLNLSKDVPDVRAPVKKVSIQDICDIVEKAMGNEAKMVSDIKIFLGHKYTGQRQITIGETFGIGDSFVSQVFRTFEKEYKCQMWRTDHLVFL